jgi:uncharacterized damage-inducible protein DinB
VSRISMILGLWENQRELLWNSIRPLTAEQAEFKAVPEMMSIRELVVHMANGEAVMTKGALEGVWDFSCRRPATGVSWEEAQRYLDQTREKSRAALQGMSDEALARPVMPPWGTSMPAEQALWIVHSHYSHHLGQVMVCMRLLGLKPPAMTHK